MVSVQDCCLKNFVKHHTKSLSYDGDVLNIKSMPVSAEARIEHAGPFGFVFGVQIGPLENKRWWSGPRRFY